MPFFNRRRGRRGPPPMLAAEESQHGIRSALRRFVVTSTVISPVHNHKPLPILLTLDARVIPRPAPGTPTIILGESTLARLEGVFHELCRRSLSFPLVPSPVTVGHSPTLARARLARFLCDVQGELPEAVAAILSRERYGFHEFVEVLFTLPSWNAWRPTDDATPDLDLSHPISHYFVSSSHNTYLVGNQLSSDASVDEYRKVLQQQCRCIEIDVWNPPAKSSRAAGRSAGQIGRERGRDRSKSPADQTTHRRHLSSSTVTEVVTEVMSNLLSGHIAHSHSRASSFSQQSLSVHGDSAVDGVGGGHVPALSPQSTVPTMASTQATGGSTGTVATLLTTATTATTATKATTADSFDAGAEAKISVTAPDAQTPVDVRPHLDDYPDEPVVMHAHNWANSDWTLGTQVPFRAVCRAVREMAFVDNPMPLIVSLEVHTNAVQQRQMVRIMREEWGGLLLDQALDGNDPRLRLPSLGELQHKILVKVKKPQVGGGTGSGSSSGSGAYDAAGVRSTNIPNGSNYPNGPNGSSRPAPMHPVANLGMSLSAVAPPEGNTSGSEEEGLSPTAPAHPAHKMTPELGGLAIYTESRSFTNFSDQSAKLPAHIFSLSETTIETLHAKQHEALFQHNRRYLMRAYPNATKHVTSSNPDPARCWRRGVQMVALNWQTLDKAMMLNHAMFAGSHGWVLKPPGYRPATPTGTKPTTLATPAQPAKPAKPVVPARCPVADAEPTCTIDLYITVLAGQHLPLPPARRGGKTDGPTGIMSGRTRKDFRPAVKCELNVEHADERCPETAEAAAAAAAAAGSTLPASLAESSLKQKTPAGRTDQPDWGVRGATLRFANISGIVQSLSFVGFYVEDDSKPAVSLSRGDALAGWACIRLDQLQTGYRFVDLWDAHGDASDGKLLVLVEKVVR